MNNKVVVGKKPDGLYTLSFSYNPSFVDVLKHRDRGESLYDLTLKCWVVSPVILDDVLSSLSKAGARIVRETMPDADGWPVYEVNIRHISQPQWRDYYDLNGRVLRYDRIGWSEAATDDGRHFLFPLDVMREYWYATPSVSNVLPPLSGDYYAVLGVDIDGIDDDKIKTAYRRRLMLYHPDRNKSATANDDVMLLKEAFESLRDVTSRRRYDIRLKLEDEIRKQTEGDNKSYREDAQWSQIRGAQPDFVVPVHSGTFVVRAMETSISWYVSAILNVR